MVSVLSTSATLLCVSANPIPKLSFANYLFNGRCPNLVGQLGVLDAKTASLFRELKSRDVASVCFLQQNKTFVVRLSRAVARVYADGDSENTLDAEGGDDADGDKQGEQETLDLLPNSESHGDSLEIDIENTGRNSRRIRSKVAVQASLQTVWDILTDYERLADFIPGLAVSQLLEKGDKFARLFQVGEQNLAFGLKFNAKGTIDCFEKDLETLPSGQKRDIEFKMVEGDFQLFEGKWSVEQGVKQDAGDLQSDSVIGQEFQTTLVYDVHVRPKVWLPVRLVEGRLCNEIRTNLSCIRIEAERVQNAHSVLS